MLLGVNYSFKETTQYHFKGIALRVRFKKNSNMVQREGSH